MSKPGQVRNPIFFAVISAVSAPAPALGEPQASRFVSSQAYYHAVVAELARAAGDDHRVVTDLELARIYDEGSAWLATRLAEKRLDQGDPIGADRLVRPLGSEANLLLARAAFLLGRRTEALRRLTRELLSPDFACTQALLDLLLDFEARPEGRMVWALLARQLEGAAGSELIVHGLSRARPDSPWSEAAWDRQLRRGAFFSPTALRLLVTVFHHADRDDDARRVVAAALMRYPGHPAVLREAARTAAHARDEPDVRRQLVRLHRAWPDATRPACREVSSLGYSALALEVCTRASVADRAIWLWRTNRPEAAARLWGPEPPREIERRRAWAALTLEAGRPEWLRKLPAEAARADPAVWALWVRAHPDRTVRRRLTDHLPAVDADPTVSGIAFAAISIVRGSEAADRWLAEATLSPPRARIIRLRGAVELGSFGPAELATLKSFDDPPLDLAARRWAEATDQREAEGQLRRLHRRDPDEPHVLHALARVALRSGAFDDARAYAQQALLRSPLDPEHWRMQADLLRDVDPIAAHRASKVAAERTRRERRRRWKRSAGATVRSHAP